MTKTELDNIKKGIIPMPSLFASAASGGDIASIPDTPAGDGGVSFSSGYTSYYDGAEGATKKIERNKFNWILKTLSQGTFFSQTGIRYTFDQNVSDKIGGYPKDSILAVFENDSIRYAISLVDNNTWNFVTKGVDGTNWRYLDEAGKSGIYPDYGKQSVIGQASIPTGISSIQQCSDWIPMPEDGWISIEYGLTKNVYTWIVFGPANGDIPQGVNVYSNDGNYTTFTLGEGFDGNDAIFPVKKGTMMSIFATNTSQVATYARIRKFGLFK